MKAPRTASFLSVQALAENAHRYGGIMRGLLEAITDAIPHLEGGARENLEAARADAEAQLAAAGDALTAAVADLVPPELLNDDEAGC